MRSMGGVSRIIGHQGEWGVVEKGEEKSRKNKKKRDGENGPVTR